MSLKFKITYSSVNEDLVKTLIKYKLEYKVILGKVNVLANTNLKIVEPTTYIIFKPKDLIILEYEITERQNKNFYIKKLNKKYDIKDLNILLKNMK